MQLRRFPSLAQHFPFRVQAEAPIGTRSVGEAFERPTRTRWLAKAEADHSRGVTLAETDDA
jgi:hypothetical protein